MDLEVSYENNQLTYEIETNIPLTIEIFISMEPKGISDNDFAYGFSERVKIDKSSVNFNVKAENMAKSQYIIDIDLVKNVIISDKQK